MCLARLKSRTIQTMLQRSMNPPLIAVPLIVNDIHKNDGVFVSA
jgi:hypothetical protein